MPWQRAWQTAGSQSSRSSRWEGAVSGPLFASSTPSLVHSCKCMGMLAGAVSSGLLLIIIHMDSTAAASIGKVVGAQCLLCTTVCLHLTSSVL
jgi:ABC-type enterobactin transport system permease subunit